VSLKVVEVTVGYYQDIYVLQDVSLEAREGNITAIVGPNGSGKSTLLKTIYGFLIPRRGRILLDGKEITGLRPFQMLSEGIAYIMQEIGVLPHMTVEENLELGAWLFRQEKMRVSRAIEAIYQRYPLLRERRTILAGRMSGGEQRMLEIGKALMSDPELILFDEPSTGLAPKVVREIYAEIVRLKGEGRTIVLVEQNVRNALSIADHVVVLELGQVKFDGKREAVDLMQAAVPWLEIT
jgi:branched-chain amino acid transport system ATP-binding protein